MPLVINKNEVKEVSKIEPSPFAGLMKERTPRNQRLHLLKSAGRAYREKNQIAEAEECEAEIAEIEKYAPDGVMILNSKNGEVK